MFANPPSIIADLNLCQRNPFQLQDLPATKNLSFVDGETGKTIGMRPIISQDSLLWTLVCCFPLAFYHQLAMEYLVPLITGFASCLNGAPDGKITTSPATGS